MNDSLSVRSPPPLPAANNHRSLFEFLAELITAHNRGDPLPALT